MKTKMFFGAIAAAVFMLVPALRLNAQFNAAISDTLGKKNSALTNTLIARLSQERRNKNSKSGSQNPAVVTFAPAGASGVPEALADALGQNAEQRSALTEAFRQIKQGYETEIAKEGKSNNLAAAMTFFISANVMTYYQSEAPSERASENLFAALQEIMSTVPAFAEMTDAEKQKMHDWLVCMGGLAMTNYLDAKQTGDAQALENIRAFADYSLRLVLGIEAKNLNFSPNELIVQESGRDANSLSSAGKIVGVWSRKAAVANSNLITNAGYYVCRYNFNGDGTYAFKSERWDGYMRSEEWWTIEESGAFSVSGNSLTLTPRKSVATLRNRAGSVQKTSSNPLEPVTFQWRIVYSEELKETHFILTAPREIGKYGGFTGDSRFPNSYVFDQSSIIEWKF